jgi:hypothetical protein
MIDAETMRIPGWRGGDGNAAYLDKTLLHQRIELSLDDTVSTRTLGMLFLRALFAYFLFWIVFFFLILFAFAVGGESGATGVATVGFIISDIVFWLVLLLSRLTEPIAEWRVLLEDRTNSAESTYSQIAGSLRARQIPLAHTVRRMPTGIGPRHVSNRLVLTEDAYSAYVSVFGYGTSLYLGWMMWRSRRGYVLIGKYLVDLVNGMLGRTDPETIMLRTERPRAMREAVHAACREGLYVAIEGQNIPVSFGFPNGLPPIDDAGPPPPPIAIPQPPPTAGPPSSPLPEPPRPPAAEPPDFGGPELAGTDAPAQQYQEPYQHDPSGFGGLGGLGLAGTDAPAQQYQEQYHQPYQQPYQRQPGRASWLDDNSQQDQPPQQASSQYPPNPLDPGDYRRTTGNEPPYRH